MRPARWAVPALALAAGCGPVFTAQVDEPNLCMGLAPMSFPAAASPVQQVGLKLAEQVPLLGEPGVKSTVKLKDLTFTAQAGSAAFTSWQAVTVRALPPHGSSLAPLDLIAYQRDPAHLPGKTLDLSSGSADLGPYFQGGTITLELAIQGAAPPAPWTAAIEGCFSVTAHTTYAGGM